jgi:hypothetical protein
MSGFCVNLHAHKNIKPTFWHRKAARYEKAGLKMFVKLTSRFQWIILLPRKEDSLFKFQGEPDFTWIEKALQHTSKDFKTVDAKTNLMNT